MAVNLARFVPMQGSARWQVTNVPWQATNTSWGIFLRPRCRVRAGDATGTTCRVVGHDWRASDRIPVPLELAAAF
jgi:hypothetical protein